MLCEIARSLDDERLRQIETLEEELGVLLVAFSCRALDPKREERLQRIMDELGPVLQAEPVDTDDAQLEKIQRLEQGLGLSLVAVRP